MALNHQEPDHVLLDPKSYRDLFQPFHKRINIRIHQGTQWKTLPHSE